VTGSALTRIGELTFYEVLDALKAELRDELLAELRAESGNSGPAFMNVNQAAEYMGVTVGRVRKLIGSRAIAYHQESAGARVLLGRADCDAYMAEQRHEARRSPS
jgi:excisionase family DNA binding protein